MNAFPVFNHEELTRFIVVVEPNADRPFIVRDRQQSDRDILRFETPQEAHIEAEIRSRFLDIACGWGALLIHAAAYYGVRAHGIILSINQLALAQESIVQARPQDRVTVELKDYRYKLASVVHRSKPCRGKRTHAFCERSWHAPGPFDIRKSFRPILDRRDVEIIGVPVRSRCTLIRTKIVRPAGNRGTL